MSICRKCGWRWSGGLKSTCGTGNSRRPTMTAAQLRRGSTLRGFVLAWLGCLPVSSAALADDAEIARRLKDKGVNVTESNGVVTAVAVTDGGKLTDEDFGQLGRLAHLKTLSLNNCLN